LILLALMKRRVKKIIEEGFIMMNSELAAVPALDNSISIPQRKAYLKQRQAAASKHEVEQQQALRKFLGEFIQQDNNAVIEAGLWLMRYDQTASIPIAQENKHLAQMIYQHYQDKYQKYVSNNDVIAQAGLYMGVSLFAAENLERALQDRVLYGDPTMPRYMPPAATTVAVAQPIGQTPPARSAVTEQRIDGFLRPRRPILDPRARRRNKAEAHAATSLMALRHSTHFSPADAATTPTGDNGTVAIVVTPASPTRAVK
jgi:hypothetical protein